MRKTVLKYIIILFSTICYSQSEYQIGTSDIDNFWKAYDLLESAKTRTDSINIIQEHYIDNASDEFKEFIRIRNFTSKEYISKIGLYPKFWKTIRIKTEQIKGRKSEIEEIFKIYERELPTFKKPKVCFAIGCLRTGGTISKDLILIGSEMASADDTVETDELTPWLKSIIGKTGDITSMVAHETIHTQQINKRKFTLLTAVMTEGIADFLTFKILNKNINKESFAYGLKNECRLKDEFLENLDNNPKDFSNWVYNGNKSKHRPADLGYFIGFQIAKEYYNNQKNKRKAIANLLNQKKYKRIFKESKYKEKSCS